MKNKLTWKVRVDGEDYIVRCQPFKTVYDIYVDEELAVRVTRENEDQYNIEENVKVGGKVCQFVVYDGEPDFAVDGVLQGYEAAQRRKDLRNRLLLFFGGIFVTLVSSFAVFLWYVFQVSGEPVFGGYVSLVFILIFVVGGIWMVAASLKRKKEY